jgi:hypothetical protein
MFGGGTSEVQRILIARGNWAWAPRAAQHNAGPGPTRIGIEVIHG